VDPMATRPFQRRASREAAARSRCRGRETSPLPLLWRGRRLLGRAERASRCWRGWAERIRIELPGRELRSRMPRRAQDQGATLRPYRPQPLGTTSTTTTTVATTTAATTTTATTTVTAATTTTAAATTTTATTSTTTTTATATRTPTTGPSRATTPGKTT
ncbi:unnamed protein product, partial [Polarella glacialis]